jgi:predicted AlkP superfamily pyrophosphatase or phosphodiesterase
VIGISIKDRGAILPAGHLADAAYWLDPDEDHGDGFVSSDYYFSMKKLPEWVIKFNNAHSKHQFSQFEWKELDTGKTFCTLGGKTCPSIAYTYIGNELLEEFAENAIENEDLGNHEGIDILTLSFSSNDYVGHGLSPDADAIRDISRRTDQQLDKLLKFIESRIGLDNTLIVFMSDHGVAPVPHVKRDATSERVLPGDWLIEEDYVSKIGLALSGRFVDRDWHDWFLNKERVSVRLLYLNYDTISKSNVDVREVRRFVARIARGLPHIARVHTWDELLHGLTAADPVERAFQLGFYGPRSPDLVLLPRPYYMFVNERSGTTHSTPYNYDTHVPLIFYGKGIRAGTYHRSVTINDVAPTLAGLLEVEAPSGSSGSVLTEIMP